MKIHIFFHSIHGHCYQMAREIQKGAEENFGAEVKLFRVEETLSPETIASMGATETVKSFSHVPVAEVEDMLEADGIILGAPTYFGVPSAQMMAFLHQFGPEWAEGSLVRKVGTSFTAASEQNGGAETCLHNLNDFFYHQGMIIVSIPSALSYEEMHVADKPVGGYVYGSSMISGGGNDRDMSREEVRIARLQGRYMAEITGDLIKGRKD